MQYLQSIVEKNTSGTELDIIFYCDNYCGQQKNKYLLSAYAYAVATMRITSITHQFSPSLRQAYLQKIPLGGNKKRDIMELINKKIISKSYVDSYYENALKKDGQTTSEIKMLKLFYILCYFLSAWGEVIIFQRGGFIENQPNFFLSLFNNIVN